MTGRRRGGQQAPPRQLLLLILTLLALSACRPARPTIVPPTPTAIRIADLQRAISNVLEDPGLARGTWGISIKSLTRDETLVAINAHKLMMPASSLKTVTLAVAADRLGWDYTYRTRLVTQGSIENGVLNGNLIVIGSGDPTLDDWSGNATTLFAGWADLVKQAGIQKVTGGVIGDDNAFDDDGLGNGWAWDDLGASYATSVGALQFNENTAQLMLNPGAAVGDAATIDVKPGSAQLPLHNLTTTVATGTVVTLTVRPALRATALEVRGTVPAGSPMVTRNVSVLNPTLYFTNTLRDALISSGIGIAGPAQDIDELTEPLDRSNGVTVAESTTRLSGFADTMMKLSQNLFAETLLKTIGVDASGNGTAEAGRAAVRTTLTNWGVAAGDFMMVDGSGLSRYNVITTDALVAVLSHIHRDDRLRDPYIATLPEGGASGTLADRMKGTVAAGNVRAKTGSFSNARALAGFVKTADDEPLAFAIIANNYGVEPRVIDDATDAIVVALANFSRR